MKVIVVGGGLFGTAIVSSMVKEKHNVLVVDVNQAQLNRIVDNYDVMTICGNGASLELLKTANAGSAELFVAVTNNDEQNMLACYFAKQLGAKHTIARISKSDYTGDGFAFVSDKLGLNLAFAPEQLAAQRIYDMLKLPSVASVETFAGKKLSLLELPVKEDNTLCGAELNGISQKLSVPFIVCSVLRNEELFIPDGSTVIEEGDKIGVVVAQADTHKLLKALGLVQKQARDVLIVGASSTAYYLAKQLVSNGNVAKIIEIDRHYAKEFSEKVPGATVICGDGLSQDILQEEGLKTVDGLVALTGSDEQNVILAFFGKLEEVPKVIASVNRDEIDDVVTKLGLDSVVSTKKVVADIVTRYARAISNRRGNQIEALYSIMNDMAEATEFVVADDFKLVDMPIKELSIKKGSIVVGIIRGNDTIIPTGNDVIKPFDRVIVVSTQHFSDLSEVIKRK